MTTDLLVRQPPPATADAPPAGRASPRSFAYQPALDGVRALAVLGVLLYHAGVSWAPGGFLGVDAFFVLSGFLITSLLVQEWRSRGGIDLRGFWVRRGRRLLPALFLVVIAVCAYALFVARPAELDRIRGDAVGSLLYVANWRQLFSASYFDQLGTPSPLRHTWSLGIEEQWYLVWPLVLVLMLHVTKARRWLMVALTTVLAVGSAVLMAVIFRTGGDPSRVYYGTDTRAQSLLLGAVLSFVLMSPRRRPRQSEATASLFAVECAGLLAAVYLGWLWTHVTDSATWPYRGGFFAEAAAVAVLIAAATRPYSPILGRFLSIAPLRAIGRISYGVYLWHWPVYVYLTPARTGWDDAQLLFVRLTVTFALAIASYSLVELPFRQRRWSRHTTRAFSSLVGATAVIAVVAVALTASQTGPTVNDLAHVAGRSSSPPPVTRPRQRTVPRVLIAGDSVALTLGYWLDPRRDTRGIQVRTEATLGCGLAGGTVESKGEDQPTSDECSGWPLRWRKTVDEYQPSVALVLVGAWDVLDHRFGDEVMHVGSPPWITYMTHQLDTAANVLGAHGARIVLLTAPCFSQPESGVEGLPERADPKRVADLNALFRSYAKAHSTRVSVVDLHGYLCPRGRYTPTLHRTTVRDPDGTHLTPDGAKAVWRFLAGQLKQARLLPVQ